MLHKNYFFLVLPFIFLLLTTEMFRVALQKANSFRNVPLKRHLTEITMPALSPTMESGNILSWKVKEGSSVGPGDVLCEIETDKAVVDYEMQDDAILAKILMQNGTNDVQVGQNIAITVDDEDEYADFQKNMDSILKGLSSNASSSIEASDIPSATKEQDVVKKRTPLIQFIGKRNVAGPMKSLDTPKATSLDGSKSNSTGGASSHGVVSGSNVANDDVSGGYTDIKVSNMRKVIGKRLSASKQSVPHEYASIDIELDGIMKMRKELKNEFNVKVSVNDFILKSAALALESVPEANASWNSKDNKRVFQNTVDISVAVATDTGLITPIVKDVQAKGLSSINATFAELVEKARSNKLQPHEYQGGTFTVSNLGGFGISQFTAVINPPQACILAIGGGIPKVVSKKDSVQVATCMKVTLSFDRRVIDDAIASRFLNVFQKYMNHPSLLLL